MALAIDASTPALASANSGDTTTTASFTPPAGAVLCAVAWHDTASGNTTNTSVVTDSQTLGWTIHATRNRADSGGQNGQVQISTAVVGSSTAMTVTTTASNTGGSHAAGLYVLVMTGCDTTTPIDVIGEASNASGAVSIGITTVTDQAWGFLANGDWNVAAAPTAGTNQTAILSTGIGTGPDNRIYLGRQNAVTSPAGSITMSTATPTSGNTNNSIAWAFRPAAGGSSTNANPENTAGAGTANAANADIQVNADTTAGTGTANTAAAAIAVNAESASGSGAAFDATVSTAAQTSANAETTTGAGTALDPAASIAVSADASAGSGAANTAAIGIAGQPAAAAATGSAFDASISITATAELITAIAAAFGATTSGAAPDAKATSASAVSARRSAAAAVLDRHTSTVTVTGHRTSTGGVT